VSDERSESKLSGTDETNKRKENVHSGDSVPRPLGFTAILPSQFTNPTGARLLLNPSLVLAPESALRLLPSVGLL
jgi:hypothetical protein